MHIWVNRLAELGDGGSSGLLDLHISGLNTWLRLEIIGYHSKIYSLVQKGGLRKK
jgi:hypothetical protein